MGDFIPPGRLSGYKHEGKTIQVQTEYAPRPRPRITTSVVLDGRIVHKLDRPWEDGVETGELQKALESTLAEQHRQAMEIVKTKAAEFAGAPKATEAPPGYTQGSFRDSMVEVLGSLPSVIGVYEIDQGGKIIFSHNFRNIYAEWDREFEMLAQLAREFPNIIRAGNFRYGNCWFPAENVIVIDIQTRTFGIMTEPSSSIDDIQREFPELFEAVHG